VTAGNDVDLVTVRLIRIPLAVQMRSSQHFDELMREFTLITLDEAGDQVSASARPVPLRLRDLVEELTQEFGSFTTAVIQERDAAIARGDPEIDLTYHVPPAVADASRRLGDLLDEVDEFCRAGEHLITLETPPECKAFRRWYLGEFIEQVEQGREPRLWQDYVAERHPDEDWSRS
jgi:hypothetical protein